MSDQTGMPVRTILRRAGRCTTVLATLAAWLLLSNHCLFGFTEEKADSARQADECPMHAAAAPAKEKPAAKIPCCKEIRAVVAKSVTKTLALAARSFTGREYSKATFPPPLCRTSPLRSLDTGPPGSLSFAESVLQESLLGHAPPVS
jgi:hypothetical protein